MNKNVIVIGGDGFCGWATTLRLLSNGYNVAIIDNLSRRDIDEQLGTGSLTTISDISRRVEVANENFIGKLEFHKIDIAKQYGALKRLVADFQPETIIHFGEQRAAPYSMIGDIERRYTVDNNVTGTHNLCSAIIETDPKIHLIHLGTMGVYGYNKDFGKIPEGYLDITVKSTQKDTNILYPANPGSIYHMTKCLDQLLFAFYNKNWGLKVTDLHQGIVWGVSTAETLVSKELQNRFDYDGIYGTVLNRFISQAMNGFPLTIYGTGGQTRALINISDSAQCLLLAVKNPPLNGEKVRIFNQIAETRSVSELANIVANTFGAKINNLENPRKELAENELEVENAGLKSLGFRPTLLSETLMEDVAALAKDNQDNFNNSFVLNSPKW